MGSTGKSIKETSNPYRITDINEYAKSHGDIHLSKQLLEDFSNDEIKTMIDRINEVYEEFGIDPYNRNQKLIYTLKSDSNLTDVFGLGSYYRFDALQYLPGGVLSVNPKSNRKEVLDVVYHEMGHSIEMLMLDKIMKQRDFNLPNMANRIVLEAQGWRKQHFPDDDNYISNYGMTNNRELVAEAVKDYMMNKNNAKPMSKSIVHKMKRLLKSKLNISKEGE